MHDMDQTPPPPHEELGPVQPMPGASGPPKGRFRTGLRLAGVSWRIVKSEPSLMVLPILSMVFGLLLFAGLAGIFWANGTIGHAVKEAGALSSSSSSNLTSSLTPIDYVILAVYYVATAFLAVFFNAAIVAIAMKRLRGEDATLGDGLRMAAKHWRKILVWAIITATVGLILRSLQEKAGIVGQILLSIVGVVWTVITFFVVPVLLFEELGAVGSIKRSASLFRQKWGEQLTGTLGITAGVMLATLVALLVSGAIAVAVPVLGVILIVVTILGSIALSGALSGVFNAALYQYATTGQAGEGFTEADLAGAFYAKKKRRS